jgi:hypothetical protein
MTTWIDVKRFVHANYKAEELNDSLLKFLFDTGNLRSQIIFMEYAQNDFGGQWVKVNSPIGRVDEVDVVKAAEKIADMLVGGIIVSGDYVYVSNSMPLQNLDANEITEPLTRIVNIADALESELLGKDAV